MHTFKLTYNRFLTFHAELQSSHYYFICIYMCVFFIFASLGAMVEYIYCNWPTESKYIGK